MYGSTGRSGIGNSYTGNDYAGHTWQDISDLSPNGRQYMSEVTGQPTDLSGANYWHMRKDLPDMLDCATIITAESFKTPPYYHQKPVNSLENVDAKQEIEPEQYNATPDVAEAVLAPVFTEESGVDVVQRDVGGRDKLAERVIGFLVLIITAKVLWGVLT